MPQKYKVFFNNNKLFVSKKANSKISYANTFTNPDKQVIESLVNFLITDDGSNNYLILTDDLNKTWVHFCSFFEIRKAAGGVAINSNNEKLFIKRKGFWDLPKGHLEKGEKNKVAAIREVEEECGVSNLKIKQKIIKTYHTYTLKNKIVLKPTKWYLMEYAGNETLKPQIKEGITDVVWANSSVEAELLKNCYASIAAVVEKTNKILEKVLS